MRTAAEILEGFCDGYTGGVFFQPAYSGRGMYGRTCPGLHVKNDTPPFELALALADFGGGDEDMTPYELGEILGPSRMDSMGLGYIVYFPDAV